MPRFLYVNACRAYVSQVLGISAIKVQKFLCNLWNLHLDYKQLKRDTIDFECLRHANKRIHICGNSQYFFYMQILHEEFGTFLRNESNILIDLFN